MELRAQTILLTGRPGSGKGTQAKRLADANDWTHFSTGEYFRSLRGSEGALGEKVRSVYDSGALLPDWFATHLFENVVLNLAPEAGIVCDGYPRTIAQAKDFDEIVSWIDRPYVVLDLSVSDEEVTERMLLRAAEEHRPDSTSREQIQARLAVYEEHTAPMLEFFKERGVLQVLDGTGTPQEVAAVVARALAP